MNEEYDNGEDQLDQQNWMEDNEFLLEVHEASEE